MITHVPSRFIKNAIYLSYTSLKDFLKCPGSYYLKNLYRHPKNNFRIQIASPYLTLGSTVHDTIKWYLDMGGKVSDKEVLGKFRNFWLKYRGKKGGFANIEEEASFGTRGLKILENFLKNAHNLEKAMPNISFPKYHLFEDVVLMGNFDFVGQRDDGSLHIIDFKTGAHDEEDPSQLYIYAILAESNFQKDVTKASFWYLDREDNPREIVLDPLHAKLDWLKEKALELKKAINEGKWACIKEDLCRDCRTYQAIIAGKGQFQFSDFRYKKDIYFLEKA